MSEPLPETQNVLLAVCAGEVRKRDAFSYWIPSFNEDGSTSNLPRKTLYESCFKGRGKQRTLNPYKLYKKLKEIGVSEPLILRATNLPGLVVKRAERCIEAFITPLVLVDWRLFNIEENVKLIKSVCRSVFAMALHSQSEVVTHWKEFGVYLYRQQNGLPHSMATNNVFQSLLRLRELQFDGKSPQVRGQMLAHLTSSRQFPEGDAEAKKKALTRFREVVTTEPKCQTDYLYRVRETAMRIGNFCKKAGNSDIKTHISLVTAASFDVSVENGGRARDVMNHFLPFMKEEPISPEDYWTPYGRVTANPGYPRWRQWCRPVIYKKFIKGERSQQDHKYNIDRDPGDPAYFYQETLDLGAELPQFRFLDVVNPRLGYDDAIGHQIVCFAYLCSEDIIRTRIHTIAEPGNKVRVLGITKWWLNIIQSPLAHYIQDHLRSHPFAESGLSKADQAWNFLHQVEGTDRSGMTTLTSDLKEATDHIEFDVAHNLLIGFLDGIGGLTANTLEIVRTLGPRLISIGTDEFYSKRGIMMGEPLAKSVLTLHQLVAEQMAFEDIYGSHHVGFRDRAFNVGGDDIFSIGTEPYINRITHHLCTLGAEISIEKHGIFPIFSKYCERFYYVPGLLTGKSLARLRSNDYDSCGWIETVKVRLISRGCLTRDTQVEGNPAIGKSQALSDVLSYLPDKLYQKEHKLAIRDWFIKVMGPYLPPRGPILDTLKLPKSLGGLGLGFIFEDIYPHPLYQQMIHQYSTGGLDRRIREDLLRLTKQTTFRGYRLADDLESKMMHYLQDGPLVLESNLCNNFESDDGFDFPKLFNEFEYPGLPAGLKHNRIKSTGWMTFQDILEQFKRPILFLDVLCGKKSEPYRTQPWETRLRLLENLHGRGQDVGREILAPELHHVWTQKLDVEYLYYPTVNKYPYYDQYGVEVMGSALTEATVYLPSLFFIWKNRLLV